MLNKKITIIVPTYNAVDTISASIDSAFRLGEALDQLVVVDDRSTDNLQNYLLKKYPEAIKAKKIRYIVGEGKGAGEARNQALKFVKSEYLMFLDADDELINTQTIKEVLDNSDTFDIIVFSGRAENNMKLSQIDAMQSNLGITKSNLYDSGPVSKLFATDNIKRHKIMFPDNVIIGEDMIFNMRAILVSKNIFLKAKSIYRVNENEQSITHVLNFEESFCDRERLVSNIKITLSGTQYEGFLDDIVSKSFAMLIVDFAKSDVSLFVGASNMKLFIKRSGVSLKEIFTFSTLYFGKIQATLVYLSARVPLLGLALFKMLYRVKRLSKKGEDSYNI